MIDDDDLAEIDLHRWHVPPPPVGQRAAVLTRALAPVAQAPRRRIGWTIAAIAIGNALVVAILALVLVRPTHETVVVSRPAGPSLEAVVADLQRRLDERQAKLEARQAELEERMAELREARRLADELAERLRSLMAHKPHKLPVSRPDSPPASPPAAGTCTALTCAAAGYEGACCAKLVDMSRCDVPSCATNNKAPCCEKAQYAKVTLVSNPPARLTIDGKDTGQMTPAVLPLMPGKHVIMYVLTDGRREKTIVNVEAGDNRRIVKDFVPAQNDAAEPD